MELKVWYYNSPSITDDLSFRWELKLKWPEDFYVAYTVDYGINTDLIPGSMDEMEDLGAFFFYELNEGELRDSVDRSMSLGDVVQVGEIVLRCEPVGWSQLVGDEWRMIK